MSAIMLIFGHGGDQEHEVVFVGQGITRLSDHYPQLGVIITVRLNLLESKDWPSKIYNFCKDRNIKIIVLAFFLLRLFF
jgi:hypothetical protein